tara:strand:+ start:28 stop:870 length:843 start_codon:yes stop_codon:yes gene_type:complete
MPQPNFDALIVEGGAMRGIFAAGVLDAFMEQNFNPFKMLIGVSAGATNLIGYAADMPYRSRDVICSLATTGQFVNPLRFLRGGHFCDVKWLWQQSMQQFPIDADCLALTSRPFYVVTTNVHSGEANYHRVNNHNIDAVFEASCALPLLYRHYPQVSQQAMTDGGIADSIPVKFAYQQGARHILVVRSRPREYRKRVAKSPWLSDKLFAQQPGLASAVRQRAHNYNAACEFIATPPSDCHIEDISPGSNFKVTRFTKSSKLLAQGYLDGKNSALDWLKQFQ